MEEMGFCVFVCVCVGEVSRLTSPGVGSCILRPHDPNLSVWVRQRGVLDQLVGPVDTKDTV